MEVSDCTWLHDGGDVHLEDIEDFGVIAKVDHNIAFSGRFGSQGDCRIVLVELGGYYLRMGELKVNLNTFNFICKQVSMLILEFDWH